MFGERFRDWCIDNKKFEENISSFELSGISYYKDKLSYSEKNAYEIILKSLLNQCHKIPVSNASIKRLDIVFDSILLDNPLLFHVNEGKVYGDGCRIWIIPQYSMSNVEYQTNKNLCIEKLQSFCDGLRGSDWEKLLSLHNRLIKKIIYGGETQGSHEIIGPLLQHKGVCDGISKTVKAICDLINIPCIVIRGKAVQNNGMCGSHAWNAICIDGNWRFFDFTFDITISRSDSCRLTQRMDYFSKSYEDISIDHFNEDMEIGLFSKGRDYYDANSLVIYKQEDLERLVNSLNNRHYECIFKIDRLCKEYTDENEIQRAVRRCVNLSVRGCHYYFAFNNNQRTGYIRIE